MKEIMKWVSKILFMAFAIAVIGYTAYQTFLLAARLAPGNFILQILVCVFFDGAGLTWFSLFLFSAEGIAQWGISLIGWLVGIIGAFIMAGAELVFSQQLVMIENPEKFGWAIVIAVVVACLLHCFFAYLYHMLAPNNWRAINSSIKLAQMEDQAFKNALTETERQLDQVVQPLTQTFLDMLEMGVQNKSALFRRNFEGQRGNVIDARARDVRQPAPAPTLTPSQAKRTGWSLFGRRRPGRPAQAAAAPAPTQATTYYPDLSKIDDLLARLKAWEDANGAAAPARPAQAQVYASETTPPPDLVDRRHVAQTYHKMDLQPGGEYTCPYCGSKRTILNPKQNGREKCPNCGGDMELTSPARRGDPEKTGPLASQDGTK